jgi:hypothetical protein
MLVTIIDKIMEQNYFQLNYYSNDITSGFSVARITVPKTDLEWSRNHRCECLFLAPELPCKLSEVQAVTSLKALLSQYTNVTCHHTVSMATDYQKSVFLFLVIFNLSYFRSILGTVALF